ncbi:hypothetical protein ABE288_07875 [Bacillus salipaludis]|uniref:hypothetical protein n=1 Tax=Bacillus salipaludis TaxID=2547811 RepID=UPI003D20A9AE
MHYIIVTNGFVRKIDALQLGIFSLGFSSLYAAIGNFIFEIPVLPKEVIDWFAILGLALICLWLCHAVNCSKYVCTFLPRP